MRASSATPDLLCRALGETPRPGTAALVPFAWGGWMLCCMTEAGPRGFQISSHGTTDGLRCEGLDTFNGDSDPAEVVALLLAAIAGGKTWGGGAWRDVSYMLAPQIAAGLESGASANPAPDGHPKT